MQSIGKCKQALQINTLAMDNLSLLNKQIFYAMHEHEYNNNKKKTICNRFVFIKCEMNQRKGKIAYQGRVG